VNSSQSVDCFFIALAKRMAAEAAERTGSHPATRPGSRGPVGPFPAERRT
jgi:hypothetical protein